MKGIDVSEAYYAEDEPGLPPDANAPAGNAAADEGQPPVTLSLSQSQAQQAAQLAQQGAYDELGRLFAGLLGGA